MHRENGIAQQLLATISRRRPVGVRHGRANRRGGGQYGEGKYALHGAPFCLASG
jgi:hypothetical protein